MSNRAIQNITILGPAHPFRGGIASFNERLATELQHKGKQVKLLTYTTQYPSLIFPGKNQFTEDPPPANLDITRTFSTINPLSWRSTVHLLKKEKPDLVISRFWLPYTSLSTNYIHKKLKQSKSIRQLSIVDNLIPHQNMPGDGWMIDQFLQSIEHYVCLSNGVLSDLKSKKNDAKATSILHPIYDHYGESISKDKAALQLDLDPNYNYLLFFGFIKQYKGLDLLLESLDPAFLKERNMKLLIAGDVYGSSKPYDDIIARKKLGDFILFHKAYIPNEKIAAYFSIADLVVQPYRTATQSGISQIALHFEKPVIVTDVGSLADFVAHEKTGYVIPVDIDAIRNAIHDHFTNGDSALITQHIQKQKEDFGWDKFVSQLLVFAEQISPSKSPSRET